jgi:hypothetical protein
MAGFDPFCDRLSRDIRNSLSVAFARSLEKRQPSQYRAVADKWLAAKPADPYGDYIRDRLRRYQQVFAQIEENHLGDVLMQALVIWNMGLFFEFHEHIENIWHQSTGDQHRALQGLIQAAGVYIHLEYGRLQAAAGLAAKAQGLLRSSAHCLTTITNLENLLDKLSKLDPVAPPLINPALKPQHQRSFG